MNIIVLLAGNGERFKNYSNIPKPYIKIKNKTIVEWTLSSLDIDIKQVHFAIKTEDLVYFKNTFNTENYFLFDKTTRGNLETALICIDKIEDDGPILFLDGDNYFNGKYFFDRIDSIKFPEFALISYFEPLDNSSKWCFAKTNQGCVLDILEKDDTALKKGYKPMIGTFYFSNKKMFTNIAKSIIINNEIVMNEYYLSQSIKKLIKQNKDIFSYKASNVVPLGTPEDVEYFKENYENLRRFR